MRNSQINWIIKILVSFLLVWALYRQVFAKEDVGEIYQTFLESLSGANLIFLLIACALMPVNWALETLKWRALIKNFEVQSFWKSYKAIFAGTTLSIFTPNRIGEYGGRILFVKPENNWKTVIATLVGSYSQLMVLLTGGLIGLIYFSQTYLEINVFLLRGVVFLGSLLIAAMVFCFFNIDLIIPIAKRIPFIDYIKPFLKNLTVLKNYTVKELSIALGMGTLRYFVYSFQYYLMIRFLGIDVGVIEGLAAVATIFLLQTSVPLPPIMGLLVRGEVALTVWGFFTTLNLNILAATFSLWILNLIIPALIGTLFILNVDVLKSLGYESEKH